MKMLQEIYQYKLGTDLIEASKTGLVSFGQGRRTADSAKRQLYNTAINIANKYTKATLTASDTFRLFARGQYDRKMVGELVDILKKSGKYRINTMRYADSGQYWELKRIGTPLRIA